MSSVDDLGSARRQEGPQEDQLLGVLADVDEPARSGQFRAEPADVDVALGVGLGHAQKRRVQAAAVVEVELGGLIEDGVAVDRRAEIRSPGGQSRR